MNEMYMCKENIILEKVICVVPYGGESFLADDLDTGFYGYRHEKLKIE
jgi:hypothetical protein